MARASLSSALLPAGEIVDGKYAIVRVLGEGGMGVVYEATHLRLRRSIAIKMLRPETLGDAEAVARFEREARAAAQLKSPHVARVSDVDVAPGGAPYMVMEYLEGHDLAKEIDRRGPLPLGEATRWLLQACEAIDEAHSLGIVHRDLKPSNLFLATENGVQTVKVLDFGISKMTTESETNVTVTGSMLGTPLYMSPEQVRSAKHVTRRTDVWSLGAIFYEMLTGRPAFDGPSPTAVAASIVTEEPTPVSQIRTDVPAEVDELVSRALTKDATARLATVGELALALTRLGQGAISDRPVARNSSAAAMTALHQRAMGEAPTERTWSSRGSTQPGTRRYLLLAGAGAVLGSILLVLLDPATSTPSATASSVPAGSEGATHPAPQLGAPGSPVHAPANVDPPVAPAPSASAPEAASATSAPAAATRRSRTERTERTPPPESPPPAAATPDSPPRPAPVTSPTPTVGKSGRF